MAEATVDSPVWIRLREIGGEVEPEELTYQLSRKGIELYRGHLDDLIDKGLVVKHGRGHYEAIVPAKRDRRHNHGEAFTDEDILDRVALFALITGGPPTKRSWAPHKLREQADKHEEKADVFRELMAMYDAGDWPSETVVRDRFGSLNAALVTAGFEARASGRPPIEPDRPRPIRKPKYGPEALAEAQERVARARRGGRPIELREALYEEAVAAFTEADRL